MCMALLPAGSAELASPSRLGVTEAEDLAVVAEHPVARPAVRRRRPGWPTGGARAASGRCGGAVTAGAWAGSKTTRTRLFLLSAIHRLPAGVDGQVVRRVELRLTGRHRAGVAGHRAPAAGLPVAGDRGDRARRVDAADPGAGGVGGRVGARLLGDVDVAEAVDGDAPGPVEVGGRGRAAVAGGVARREGRLGVGGGRGGGGVAGDRRDRAVGVDLADEVVAAVGDVEVAGLVDGHALRGVELGVGRPAAVTAEALRLELPATVVIVIGLALRSSIRIMLLPLSAT